MNWNFDETAPSIGNENALTIEVNTITATKIFGL
jgi:hypothetical protein